MVTYLYGIRMDEWTWSCKQTNSKRWYQDEAEPKIRGFKKYIWETREKNTIWNTNHLFKKQHLHKAMLTIAWSEVRIAISSMEPNPVRGMALLVSVLFRLEMITLRQNNLPMTKNYHMAQRISRQNIQHTQMRGALALSNIRPMTTSLPTTGTYQSMWKSKMLTKHYIREVSFCP